MSGQKVFDITIIGGGPAGMFVSFYAGLRNMSVKIIESLPQLGGQLSALYPEKYIYDVAGFPKIKGQELVDRLTAQMQMFPHEVCLGQSVQTLEKLGDGTFLLQTDKETHYTKTVVITAGNGAFQPRKLPIDKAIKYEGSNLYYFVDNMSRFAGKRVIVFGGGDSAVDWSLMLEPIAKEVTIVHRRDRFRAHEHSVSQLFESSVHVMTPYVPTDLAGKEQIEHVILRHVASGEERTVDVDAVLVNYGFVASLGPIKDWGIEIHKNSIVVNSKMETNIKGVYAVGDINTYEGKVKLIATGFGEAPIAVSNAKVYIDPSSKIQPIHSTTVMEKSKKKETV
ncbi:NAD(P)/FAD-dependent oxidoreductase [Siminovitchia sp. FSL H7-0308]|uniref:Ferredoxin--NADP reductase n=1 Tax=Siminovitchia thermophila TaxID=1245522 RepID=A0ABS2R9R5_9BACI|nr:NAD(P)/FAD-dependent oxidoreductase [Siminovitchia thermophila]MBM7716396.1 thioredoxin reductase (NADPH) [Siminovitchia thermophila]ONK21973.1 ferredoxin--NADP(+) reductase [Bacillus sp. VT-16-64]